MYSPPAKKSESESESEIGSEGRSECEVVTLSKKTVMINSSPYCLRGGRVGLRIKQGYVLE